MPASNIDRLQTPLRDEFLKKLSANFRPVGKVGQVTHGQLAFRRAAYQRGVVLTEVNVKNIANHTIEICAEAGTTWSLTGATGTPNTGTATGGTTFDEVDFAAAVPGLIVNGANASPAGSGKRVVDVP